MDDPREPDPCGGIAARYGDVLAAGWQYRTSGEPFRIEEQRELYEAMGFEVLVLPLRAGAAGGACGCGGGSGRDQVLFTRPRRAPDTTQEKGKAT